MHWGTVKLEKSCSSPLSEESHLVIGGETEMLRRMKDMEGYSISALDGFVGEVKDYYFDDASWVIRYLVVETGNWLASRKVLISPVAINGPNWSEKNIPAAITMEQVKNSPHIDTDKPVSRQHELRHLEHYDFPRYWSVRYVAHAEGSWVRRQAAMWPPSTCLVSRHTRPPKAEARNQTVRVSGVLATWPSTMYGGEHTMSY